MCRESCAVVMSRCADVHTAGRVQLHVGKINMPRQAAAQTA